MPIFPNTTYLEWFTPNLALNRYSFLVSTSLLTIITIFYIINLYTKSKADGTALNIESKSAPTIPSNSNIKRKSSSIMINKSTITQIIRFYKTGKQAKYVIFSHLMTISTMIFFIFHGLIDTLDFYGIFHGVISCSTVRILAAISFHFGKTSMYLIFAIRLLLAFNGTIFEYNNRIIYGLLFLIWNFWASCMIGDAFEILGELKYNNNFDIYWCQQLVPRWGCIATPIYDGFISFLCLYLFISPLYKIMIQSHHFDQQTVSIIVKYSVLTFIAVFTTGLVSIIMIFKSWGVIFCFDVLINVITVMLMGSDYNRCYQVLCGCSNKCVHSIMSKTKDTKNIIKEVTITDNDNNNEVVIEMDVIETETTKRIQSDQQIETIQSDLKIPHDAITIKSDISNNTAIIL